MNVLNICDYSNQQFYWNLNLCVQNCKYKTTGQLDDRNGNKNTTTLSLKKCALILSNVNYRCSWSSMCKTEYPAPDCFTVSFCAAELSLCYLFQCRFLIILSCFPKASFSFPWLPYLCFTRSDWLFGSCWEDIALLCTSAVHRLIDSSHEYRTGLHSIPFRAQVL